jgi:hypothetical protein
LVEQNGKKFYTEHIGSNNEADGENLSEEEQEIIRRQKAMLDKGFAMGKLLYKDRGELHGR